MSTIDNPENVDVRGIASSAISNALTSLAAALVAVRNASNQGDIEAAMRYLNIVANLSRSCHL